MSGPMKDVSCRVCEKVFRSGSNRVCSSCRTKSIECLTCGHVFRGLSETECFRCRKTERVCTRCEKTWYGVRGLVCPSCYSRKSECVDCGAKITGKSKRCRPCRSDLESRQSDGSTYEHNGYVLQRVYGRGLIGQHRLVMEQYLGRRLLPEENVHHRNGVRNDNRIENLELWSTSQPYGQRVEDKIAWAREILETYSRTNYKTD